MIQGFDLSSFQGAVDWNLAGHIGYQFGIVKCTQGGGYVNPFFQQQWDGLKVSGMLRGAYHYAETPISGRKNAEHFLAHVPALEHGDFLALDLEYGLNDEEEIDPHADLAAFALDFLQTVETARGFKPLLYSSVSYLTDHKCVGHPATLGQYGIWLADYQTKHPPATPDGWPVWAIWQFTGSGVVPGIQGNVDMDIFNGTRDLLAKYGRP